MKVAIYVQHLLGAGHLVRAMSLAETLSEHGYRVLLLSGGFPIDRPVSGYHYCQLPPTRATGRDFTRLVDEQNRPVDDLWRRSRTARLLAEVESFQPGLIITETFPFGRRQFRFELEPLIDWVEKQASVFLIASIRDVLQRRKAKRDRQTVETIRRYYDAVLVHADDTLFKLDASFPLSHEIEDKLIYTGYIHQSENTGTALREPGTSGTDREQDGQDEILVSGGSGTVSARLLETARQARPLSSAHFRRWRLLSGRDCSRATHSPEDGLIIEANRPDFLRLLRRCLLSVSQAGYNTTLDVLVSGAPSVMVPFSGDGETEQTDRAQALERAGRLVQLAESDLTPHNLAQAIDRALKMAPVDVPIRLNGAANSVQLIKRKMNQWSA